MSGAKIAVLVLWAVLIALAATLGGTSIGTFAAWTVGILIVVHLLEMVLFLPLARRAGGSLPGHLLQLFLFGVVHKAEMQASLGGRQAAAPEDS